jgi:hypothetical protein
VKPSYEVVLYEDSIGYFWGECAKFRIYFAGHTLEEVLRNAHLSIESQANITDFNINYRIVKYDKTKRTSK